VRGQLPGLKVCGILMLMSFYRRRLPHWLPANQPMFLTFSLFGSVPAERSFDRQIIASNGQAFAAYDQILDRADFGARYLAIPAIADAVRQVLLQTAEELAIPLHAWVIMPNHVHLATGAGDCPRLLKLVKGRSSRVANLMLGTTGRPFWQEESYDRWMRSPAELRSVCGYVLANPVKAGLVGSAELYRWSSGYEGLRRAGGDESPRGLKPAVP